MVSLTSTRVTNPVVYVSWIQTPVAVTGVVNVASSHSVPEPAVLGAHACALSLHDETFGAPAARAALQLPVLYCVLATAVLAHTVPVGGPTTLYAFTVAWPVFELHGSTSTV